MPAVPDPDPDPDVEPVSEGGHHLTVDIVDDDQALGELVDAVVYLDVEARERAADLLVLHDALRAGLEPDQYQLLLRIEETSTARWSDHLSLVLVRWAFHEGLNCASVSKGVST